MNYDYRKYFPHTEIRPEQVRAIDFILEQFLDNNERHVITEVGTGGGKSAIAITVARYMNSLGFGDAYLLTTQKVLQDQYMDDFVRTGLRSIRSSTNYGCTYHADQTCAESRRVLKQLKEDLEGTEYAEHCTHNCNYMLEKHAFINSPMGVTNFPYFLAETMYAKAFKPRNLLIIDEAHNADDNLRRFIEVSVSSKFAKDVLGCKPPPVSADQERVFAWLMGEYRTHLKRYAEKLIKVIKANSALERTRANGLTSFTCKEIKQYEAMDKHLCKMNRFVNEYDPDNWVMNVTQKPRTYSFEFKPIDVAPYGEERLFSFGKYVLLMSATITNKDIFCRNIGLPPTTPFLSIPSPFPIENRRVHFLPVGSMSRKHIDDTLPKLAETVTMLLEQHSSEKGLIHANSYKIAQYLFENVKSDRLLIHTSEDRDIVLRNHIASDRPTVLISPSMTEGINLVGDSSRFQLVCKVPFPYLGDKLVTKKMKADPEWYAFQTARTVMQALGRSVRSVDDYATSYILDLDWERFYRKNSHMFSGDFSTTLS
jgi:ATP-dependent DNA helicase DinG